MKPKLRSLALFFILGMLALVNLALQNPAPLFQDVTPTPVVSPTPLGSTSQPEVTNGIAFLGILIFAVIVFSIALHLRNLRAAKH